MTVKADRHRPLSGRARTLALLMAVALVGPVALEATSATADGNEAPGNPAEFRSITAGDNHTCAILDDGTVKCWGGNSRGQLGLGDTANRGDGAGEMGDNLPAVNLGTGRTATAITAGDTHTCALLDNGTVKCWGDNGYGQLGHGDTANRGDDAGEMGDNLPAVNLGTGRTATAITAGSSHTCALLDNGTVKCWGDNGDGQLGLGDTADRGDGAGEMGDNLPAVDLGTGRTATAITAGDDHTCALLDNGTVKCWGDNAYGQLGLGDTADRGDDAGEMGDNLPAVDLGTGRTATAITAGDVHTCALLDNATVKCWGYNGHGPARPRRHRRPRRRPRRDGRQPPRRRPRHRPHRHRHHRRRQPHLRPARQRHRQVLGRQQHRAARPRRHRRPRRRPPARWATTSPPSTSAPAAPPPPSPPAATTPAPCSTTPPSSAGATASTASSATATPPTAATAPGEMGDNLPAVDLGTGRNGRPAWPGSA